MADFPQEGGCLCGDVRYALKEDPVTLHACHCTDCQRHTGTSYVLSMVVKQESLEIVRGEPSSYSVVLPDGRKKTGVFCPRCCTRLWGEPGKLTGFRVLRPGTLDDTSWFRPIAHIWTRSAQPWVEIPADTLDYPGQPEGDEIMAMVRAWRNREPPKP